MKELCLVRLSSLGDIVQTLPLLGLCVERGHRVRWVVEERFAAILDHSRWPVEPVAWKRGLRGLVALRGAARGLRFVCDLQGNTKSGLVSAFLGAECELGSAREDLRELANLVFTRRRARPSLGAHVLDRGLAVLSLALGAELSRADLPALPSLVSTEPVELAEAPSLVVVLGRPADPRTWPLASSLEFAQAYPGRVLCLLGPAESELELPPGLPVLRQRSGQLGALVALGALLAAEGGIAVGHDGGAMQVLHAAGARTLFLCGPQDPDRTVPPAAATLVARGPLECRPCFKRRCELDGGNLCMQGIGAVDVLAKLGAMLDSGRSARCMPES